MQAPYLSSILPQAAIQYLQRLAESLTNTETAVGKLQRAGYITSAQVPGGVDHTRIVQALQASGACPLNVSNLIGKLAQPQLAGAPQVTALPAFNNPLSQEGALIRFNGLLYFFDQSVDPGTWKPVTGVGVFLVGTHAQRISATYTPPSLYPSGTVFYETDRGLLYIVNAGFWDYLSGIYTLAYASIAALTATLTTHDTGLLVHVNNFDHTIKWGGAALWGWAPGDMQGGYVQDYAVDPDNLESGWHLCDGGATTYLKITAGVLSTPAFTTPDTVGTPAYKKMGSPYTGVINPATAPTIMGNTTGIFISPSTGATTAGGPDPYIISVSLTDPGHDHVADIDGEPANVVFRPWFRR